MTDFIAGAALPEIYCVHLIYKFVNSNVKLTKNSVLLLGCIGRATINVFNDFRYNHE